MHIAGKLTLTSAVLVANTSNNKHNITWQGTILSQLAWGQTDITK
jgi:hypothetical protein